MINFPEKFNKLISSSGQNVLLVSAGGGFDIFASLPIFYALNHYGFNVDFLSYSNTTISEASNYTSTEDFGYSIFSIGNEIKNNSSNFPELYVNNFLKEGFEFEKSIYIINRKQTIENVITAYENLVKILNVNSIIVCGFGQKTICFGNEETDTDTINHIMNIAAISKIQNVSKAICNIGFESSPRSKLSFETSIENISLLAQRKSMLGGFQLESDMDEFVFMKSAFEYLINFGEHERSPLLERVIMGVCGQVGTHEQDSGHISAIMGNTYMFELNSCAALNIISPNLFGHEDYVSAIQTGLSIISSQKKRAPVELSI